MKKLKWILIFSIIFIIAIVIIGCGKTTINLNKYITITSDGYNSLGTVSYDFDYEAFENDYAGKIKFNSKNIGDEYASLSFLMNENIERTFLYTCVDQEIDKTSGLSNGDTVTLRWNCKDTLAKEYFKVKLKYSDIKHTVRGLKTVETFNPFEYVQISFSGISPNGNVIITPSYDKQEMQYITFDCENDGSISNGDSVIVTAEISGSIDSFVKKFGTVLEVTEKTYNVDSLAKYITDIGEISQDTYEKIDKQLRDVMTAHFASWDSEYLKNMDLLGTYTVSLKEGMSDDTFNYIYFVYKITAENDDYDTPYDYYWYAYFTDVAVYIDGTSNIDISAYTEADSGWFSSEVIEIGGRNYYGFLNLESLFNSHILAKIERYEYSSTIKE